MNRNKVAVYCENVTKSYMAGTARSLALRGVDLEVRLGELLMLVGPSGCGKTTLISVMAGILDHDEGTFLVFDGEVLQMNIRPGEFAQSGALPQPLILLGSVDRLHVRVDIDENDAWRFTPEAPAVAYLRGHAEYRTDLTFEYVEAYVIPKRSLTGESTERVDTRVLQVVYSFPRERLPVYPGQQVDVYIEDRTPMVPGGGQGGKK